MLGRIIAFVSCLMCAFPFLIISTYNKESKEPNNFWSGDTTLTTFVNPPFYCDYGSNIEVGKNCFINYNCVILDNAKVKLGDNCLLAPNVSIYTAGHTLHPDARSLGYEYGIEITVGDNVWIGGNVVICPGVHIGIASLLKKK